MNEPGVRWDGHRWVSVDGLWTWNGNRWLQLGSNLPVAARVAIYAAASLVNLPFIFVLALVWGLQGPGWATNPPDVIGSLVQISLTLGAALVAFCAGWFLVRIDRRDWWLGAVVAWPWIASAVAMLYGFISSQPLNASALFIGVGLLLLAALPLAGSILGRSTHGSAIARSPQSATPGTSWFRGAATATWLFLRALIGAAFIADTVVGGSPVELPADVSGDGKFKWDGERWVLIEQSQSQPIEQSQSQPIDAIVPAPPRGLRIFLLVALVLMAAITGSFTVFALVGMTGEALNSGSIALFGVFALLFALATAATIGVARRAAWARVVAISAGAAFSLTCLGLVLGVPILIAAARAPDLGAKPYVDFSGESA